MRKFNRWFPLIFWMFVIFFLSANPDPYRWLPASWRLIRVGGSAASSLDDVIGMGLHVFEYAVLVVLILRARVWGRSLRKEDFLAVVSFTMLYALSDEIHQIFVPGRAFQLADLGLDLVGALAGLWIYSVVRNSRTKKAG